MSYVTLPYPFKPVEAPPEYRGKPVVDPSKCIGCGACANACPPDAIRMEIDEAKGVKRLILDVSRCIRCARCEEVCPMGAVKLSREFELATPRKEDLVTVIELKLFRCRVCGKPTEFTVRQVEKAKSLARYLPKERFEEILESMTLCRDCRRSRYVSKLVEIEIRGYVGSMGGLHA